jgi:hypothetical protein
MGPAYDAADSLKFFDDVAPLLKEMTRTMVSRSIWGMRRFVSLRRQCKPLEAQLREMGIDVEAVRSVGMARRCRNLERSV